MFAKIAENSPANWTVITIMWKPAFKNTGFSARCRKLDRSDHKMVEETFLSDKWNFFQRSPLRLPMRLELYNGNILGDEFGPSFPYNVAITKKGIASPKESHNAIRHHRHSVTCNLKMADFRYDIQKLSAETEKNHFALQRLLNENRLFQNLHFFFALRQIFGFYIMPKGCSRSSCLKMPDEKWSS